jgi:hypothetical protein
MSKYQMLIILTCFVLQPTYSQAELPPCYRLESQLCSNLTPVNTYCEHTLCVNNRCPDGTVEDGPYYKEVNQVVDDPLRLSDSYTTFNARPEYVQCRVRRDCTRCIVAADDVLRCYEPGYLHGDPNSWEYDDWVDFEGVDSCPEY